MLARLLLLAIIIALLVWARKSTPAHNKAGHSLNSLPTSNTEPQPLKVATFNIQTGKNLAGQRNLLASADVMKQADIVGVQEVYAPSLTNLVGLGLSQTESVAKHAGFGWLFAATRRRWLREHRGNALLSKLALDGWQVEMLPDRSNKSFRNMIVATVRWQNQSFTLINTHLHTKTGREGQLEVVLQEFAKHPRAILLGDFNSPATEPKLANALKDIEITDAVKEAGLDLDNPQRIDWILTKGFNVNGGRMIEKGVSDHPYYEVHLTYK